MLHYVGRHLTTLDAGQFVHATVPVMHAQHTLARRVSCLHQRNAPFNAALGKGHFAAAPAEWPGETAADNNHWQNT